MRAGAHCVGTDHVANWRVVDTSGLVNPWPWGIDLGPWA